MTVLFNTNKEGNHQKCPFCFQERQKRKGCKILCSVIQKVNIRELILSNHINTEKKKMEKVLHKIKGEKGKQYIEKCFNVITKVRLDRRLCSLRQ